MSESRTETGERLFGIPKYISRYFHHITASAKQTSPASYVRKLFNVLPFQLFLLVIMLIFTAKFISIRRFLIKNETLCIFMFLVAVTSAILLRTSSLIQD